VRERKGFVEGNIGENCQRIKVIRKRKKKVAWPSGKHGRNPKRDHSLQKRKGGGEGRG